MTSHSIHRDRFCLENCITWIDTIRARNVCLYFLPRFYCLASEIVLKLKSRHSEINYMVMISGSSGVDTLKYRIKDDKFNPDGVIYFGTSCLCTSKYSTTLPILFMPLDKDTNELEYLSNCLSQQIEQYTNILLLSDLTNSSILLEKDWIASIFNQGKSINIAKYLEPDAKNLHFTKSTLDLFVSNQEELSNQPYFPYFIPNQLAQYDLVIFLGDCNNLELIINCQNLVVIDPQNKCFQKFDGPREFRKRVSLIEKFKTQSISHFGVVFLNYTESVTSIMNLTKSFCKELKKIPYFLSLNQTDFEQRLGNFGQLEGFVLVNSCECNFNIALNTSKYLYPIIFWKEFLIVCSQRIVYGGIEWNEDVAEQQENAEEDENENQANMELIERDLFKRPEGWFGLVVDAGAKQVGDIKEGLRGIPSSYTNEEELF